MKSKLLMEDSAESATKIVKGANMNPAILESLKPLEGMNLKAAAKHLAKQGVLDIYFGKTKGLKQDYSNIFIEFPDHIVAVGLSQGLDEEGVKEDIVSKRWGCQFYIRNRRLKDINGVELDGEDENPTGPLGISFGKAGGLQVVETTTFDSMVATQPGVKQN